jgi:hypothetical protein
MGVKSMEREQERDVMGQLTAALSVPDGRPAMRIIEKAGRSFDDLTMDVPVTRASAKTVHVEPEPPRMDHVRLNGEWHSDDWDRVAAYSITRMTWEQYAIMMDEVNDIIRELAEQFPKLSPTERGNKALHRWAKKKLTNES